MEQDTLAIHGGAPVRTRPFPAWPQYGHEEEEALAGVLHSRAWGGYHPAVKELEQSFAAVHGVPHAVSCANGTVALQVALDALGVKPGDEVIVPPFTFVASATAVLLCNATPVFADIDPETFNLSLKAAEAAITPKTRAIVVVHFGGRPAPLDAFQALARKHGLALLEDAAHAHGAKWMGTPVGAWGDAATFSFQEFKLMTAGEGGIIVTRSAEVADRCWAFCNQGRKRGGGWFEHYTLGTNYRLTGFQAAVLAAQLRRLPEQTRTRAANYTYLREHLRDVPGFRLPEDDPRITDQPFYLLTFWYDADAFEGLPRDIVLAALKAEGVPFKATYPHPLYRNPVFGAKDLGLPVVERACREGVWLSHNALLGDRSDIDDLVEALRKVRRLASTLHAVAAEHR
jgi:dTDP-4-amino-4,6-dideoxygalactose transaminase